MIKTKHPITIKRREEVKKIKSRHQWIHFTESLSYPLLMEVLKLQPARITRANKCRIIKKTVDKINKENIPYQTINLSGRPPTRKLKLTKEIAAATQNMKYSIIAQKYNVPKSMITYYKKKHTGS